MTDSRLADSPADIQQLISDWPLALIFDLKPGQDVVVAGAYEGKVIDLLLDLYPGTRVFGFDPQAWAIDAAIQRLRRHTPTTWSLFHYGLGVEDAMLPMGEWHTDAASFFNPGPHSRIQGEGELVDFRKCMIGAGINHIDLLILNMEGYEFRLLPYLEQVGWIDRIDKLAVQWHPGLDPDFTKDRTDLVIADLENNGLALIHDERPTWTYHVRETK